MLLVFFPLAFTGICQGELDEIRDHLPDYENDDTADAGHLGGSAAHPQDLGHPERLHLPGAVRLLAARRGGQAYGVFNDDAGFANRGTFVVDRAGVIRFAEMKQPGEPRDQAVWTDALKALQAG